MKNTSIAYQVGEALYLNITNRCTNECTFCIRYINRLFNQEHELWLEHEPTAKEVMSAIGDPKQWPEIVFCGYGEPLLRLDVVKAVAKWIKTKSKKIKVRVDTNGSANLFFGRNILPELKGLVDEMSISLNAPNAATYKKITRPVYGEKSFEAVKEFIKLAKLSIPNVVATTVDLPNLDQKTSAKIAKKLGVRFRIRPYYEKKYKK